MKEHPTHGCEAAVVKCIDYRFTKIINEWLKEKFEDREMQYDVISLAGGTKDLDTISKQVDISVNLHHINQLILIHHEECGAYGIESTPEKHREDLLKAKKEIGEKYPNLQISLYYLQLDGKFNGVA